MEAYMTTCFHTMLWSLPPLTSILYVLYIDQSLGTLILPSLGSLAWKPYIPVPLQPQDVCKEALTSN